MIDVRYLKKLVEAVSEEVPKMKVGIKKNMCYIFTVDELGDLKVIAGDRTVSYDRDSISEAISDLKESSKYEHKFLCNVSYPFLVKLFDLYKKDSFESFTEIKSAITKVLAEYYDFKIVCSCNTFDSNYLLKELNNLVNQKVLKTAENSALELLIEL